MLRIVGIQAESRATVVVDPYVPLDVELGGAECSGKLYWRALWQAEALLEVGVHPETGALMTVTLTSIPRSHIQLGQVSLPPSRGEGLPRAALEQWSHPRHRYAEHFIDEQVEMSLFVAEDRAVLMLGEGEPLDEVWSVGRVRLGLDSRRRLRAVEAQGLSPEEVTLLATPADR